MPWIRYEYMIDFVFNHLVQSCLQKRIRPRVIQLPITGKCNAKCIICNIWKDSEKVDIEPEKLKEALTDPFFKKVHSVGVNGGEPALFKGMKSLLEALFVLNNLKRLYFISNGMSVKLLPMMETIKAACLKRNITVYLTISIDGIGREHDLIHGIPGSFQKSIETLGEIRKQKEKYCDYLEVGCSVCRQNVTRLVEIEAYMDKMSIPVNFHLAVPNKRLYNFDKNNFSVLDDDRSRLLAAEYFFYRFKKGKNFKMRMRSFLIFQYLLNKGKKRFAGCNYLRSDITITESLDLYLCATASEKIGNLALDKASELNKKRIFKEIESKTALSCQGCGHYILFPTLKGLFLYLNNRLVPIVWLRYKWKSLWLR